MLQENYLDEIVNLDVFCNKCDLNSEYIIRNYDDGISEFTCHLVVTQLQLKHKYSYYKTTFLQ